MMSGMLHAKMQRPVELVPPDDVSDRLALPNPELADCLQKALQTFDNRSPWP